MIVNSNRAHTVSGGRFSTMAFLLLPLVAATLLIRSERISVDRREPVVIPMISVRPPVDLNAASEEALWLARAIYSESKRPEEQRLVAWVIRNRVETEFREKDTYERVVLDPYQFSAFNPGTRKRRYYSSLVETDSVPGWQTALQIARKVIDADFTERPFPIQTRHFFSERSMPGVINPDSGAVIPNWASGDRQVGRNVSVDARRFRFYKGVM